MDDLRDEVERLAQPIPGDVALDAVGTSVQLVPVVGGFMGSVVDRVRRKREDRQLDFWRHVAGAVEALGERMDADFARSVAFEEMVEEVVERTAHASEVAKRDYYAAALANAATGAWPDDAERQRLLDTLRDLRLSHLHLLATIEATTDGAPPGVSGSVEATFANVLPGVDLEAIKRDWADLARHDLVAGYPGGMMHREGITNLQQRLTPLGRRFCAFIRSHDKSP